MLTVSWKQEDYEFKTNLDLIMRTCLKKKMLRADKMVQWVKSGHTYHKTPMTSFFKKLLDNA